MAPSELTSNVFKTALLFEGGSMRAAYTSGVAAYLLERGVYFDHVYGISAGSSNTVNYLSRDIERTVRSFTDFITLPQIGNVRTWLAHKGMFNAHFIYREAGLPGAVLPFDFETFRANPAKCTVLSYARDAGRDLFFTKEEMDRSLDDLMVRVRASSTLPLFMPPPLVDGQYCYDGGFAVGGGLPLEKIAADGFEHVFVVRTRKRGYRKPAGGNGWAKLFFARRPHMREAMLTRNDRYNAACDLLDEWERDGRAHVFYCDELTLKGTERDYDELMGNFESGYNQFKREFGALEEFLAGAEA